MSVRYGLPNIDIIFTQKAVTAVQRSERGVLAIIVKDSKQTQGVTRFTYKRLSDIKAADFSEPNLTDIKRAFDVAVNKVYVFRCAGATEPVDAVREIEKVKFNYICTNDSNYQQGLATYTKQFNATSKGHKIVCVVANVETADSKYIVNVKGTGGTLKSGGNVTANSYVVRIASTLCNLPMNRSLTYYVFSDLASWDDTYINADNTIDSWIDKGFLTLINDDDQVKCGRAVNSLVTFTSTDTEDMSHILIVEAMNMILEDIYDTFKNYYVGKYKNTLSNQRLFISSVNTYFKQLGREEVLDSAYDNHAYIDIESQRLAWTGIGKEEAADWDDHTVETMTFRTNVYLGGNAKISDAMEDLRFEIALA